MVDVGQLVIDTSDVVVNSLHLLVDILNTVAKLATRFKMSTSCTSPRLAPGILYLPSPLDILQSIVYAHHFAIAVSHLQQLRTCHPCLFLCQPVQPLQAILDISVSRQLQIRS